MTTFHLPIAHAEQSPAKAAYDRRRCNSTDSTTCSDVADTHDRLQSALSKCDPKSGACAIEWLTDECLVQTYFAEQLFPTVCPDSPCPEGDLTCELLVGPSTCTGDCPGDD